MEKSKLKVSQNESETHDNHESTGKDVKHYNKAGTKAENQGTTSDLTEVFYKCGICDKKFVDFTNEWYIANYTTPCQRTFIMEEILKQHLKEDHEDETQVLLNKENHLDSGVK